jgi:hypothetical protein
MIFKEAFKDDLERLTKEGKHHKLPSPEYGYYGRFDSTFNTEGINILPYHEC